MLVIDPSSFPSRSYSLHIYGWHRKLFFSSDGISRFCLLYQKYQEIVSDNQLHVPLRCYHLRYLQFGVGYWYDQKISKHGDILLLYVRTHARKSVCVCTCVYMYVYQSQLQTSAGQPKISKIKIKIAITSERNKYFTRFFV